MRVIADAINVTNLPANVDGYAGYVDGLWPTFPYMPVKATRWSIAVRATSYAMWLDVEGGDATPEQAVTWREQVNPHGGIYAARDTWSAVAAAFGSRPLPPWWAAVPGAPALYPGSVATQYGGVAGVYDLSIAVDHIPGIDLAEDNMLAPVYRVSDGPVMGFEFHNFGSGPVHIDAATSADLIAAGAQVIPVSDAVFETIPNVVGR